MRTRLLIWLCLLVSLPVSAFDLGSLVDTVKGVAKSQQVASMSEADEIAVGKQIAARTLGSYRIIRDEKLQRYLNAVGLWVALQSERPDLPWRFAAVESGQINAYAVPGGAVLVTRGMLQMVANEAELACVIGHEIGHVVRRHHIELLQKEMLLQTGAGVVADQVDGGGLQEQAKVLIVTEGAELYARALDRDSERDADADAVLHAARAGYDPGACLLFMQRLAGLKQQDNALTSLYKTHPRAADRAADISVSLQRLQGVEPGSGLRPVLGYDRAKM